MSFRRRMAALLLGTTVLLGAAPAVAGTPPRSRDFIDVSSNNPYPQLPDYARAHSRIGVKANEGTGYVWSQHKYIADEAHSLGLQVWHYDFARPGSNQPAAEAGVLVRVAKADWRPGDRLVLDLESAGDGTSGGLSDRSLAAWVAAYEKTAESAGLGKLVVYSGWWFVGPRPRTLAAVGQRDFWYSAYQDTLPQFHGLNVIAWQFTDHEVVAGESRPVDASHDLTPAPVVSPTASSCELLWWTNHGCYTPQTIPSEARGVSNHASAYAWWTGHGWSDVHVIPAAVPGVLHFVWTSRGWRPTQ